MNAVLVTDEAGLELVADFFRRNSVFGIDTETNLVDTYNQRRLRTIQVGNKDEQYVIDLLPFVERSGNGSLYWNQGNFECSDALKPVLHTLQPVLESKEWMKVGHNLEFEYTMLRWCLGINSYNFYDTLLAEKVIYCGDVNFFTKDFWALDDLVARRLGLLMSKEFQTSFDLSTPLTLDQINYAALDCRVVLALKSTQHSDLLKGNLFEAANIEFHAIPAAGDIHMNGVGIDSDKWLANVDDNKRKKAQVVRRMDSFFVPIVGLKETPMSEEEVAILEDRWRYEKDKTTRAVYRVDYMNAARTRTDWKKNGTKYEGDAKINYSSSAQLKEALRSIGYKASELPDTNDGTLKKLSSFKEIKADKILAEDPTLSKVTNVIDLLRLYRIFEKRLTTYGEEFLTKYINLDSGRIHQRFHQLGAATGRTASADPNMQNLPQEESYRSCFTARPGYKLITLDYNGCELRILTEYSQEMVWVEGFTKGWDIHSLGASILYGKRWSDAEHAECNWHTRKGKCDKKKCPIHDDLRNRVKAINFGIAYGMAAKRLSEELSIPITEAEELLKLYYKAFPTLVKYLENSGKRAASKLEARTLSQRRRIFEKPTWDKARDIARRKNAERNKKSMFAKPGVSDEPNSAQVMSAYRQLFAAIEREGKNTPIQGSNADMIKLAVGSGWDKNGKPFLWHLLREFGAMLLNIIHDEIVIEVPEQHADTVFAIAMDCMVRAGEEYIKTIPVTAEGKISDCWSKG